MNTNPSILAIGEQAVFNRGLAVVVDQDPRLAWAGEASSAEQAVRHHSQPTLVLLTLNAGRASALQAVQTLRLQWPGTAVLTLLNEPDTTTARAVLAAGAVGCVLKSVTASALQQYLQDALQGRRCLSPSLQAALNGQNREQRLGADLTQRELTLLTLMAQGLPNQAISAQLQIGLPTVKFHITNILSKLEAENRTAAVMTALRGRLVILPPTAQTAQTAQMAQSAQTAQTAQTAQHSPH